jgi:hypothetical protein
MTPEDDGPAEYYEYEGCLPGSVMHRISQLDPDGRDTEPTEADYEGFRDHVVATYGQEAWDAYRGRRDLEAG